MHSRIDKARRVTGADQTISIVSLFRAYDSSGLSHKQTTHEVTYKLNRLYLIMITPILSPIIIGRLGSGVCVNKKAVYVCLLDVIISMDNYQKQILDLT